jgi:hypothetical protein
LFLLFLFVACCWRYWLLLFVVVAGNCSCLLLRSLIVAVASCLRWRWFLSLLVVAIVSWLPFVINFLATVGRWSLLVVATYYRGYYLLDCYILYLFSAVVAFRCCCFMLALLHVGVAWCWRCLISALLNVRVA